MYPKMRDWPVYIWYHIEFVWVRASGEVVKFTELFEPFSMTKKSYNKIRDWFESNYPTSNEDSLKFRITDCTVEWDNAPE